MTTSVNKLNLQKKLRGSFVGISYSDTEYGPIFTEYDGNLRFKFIHVSPMTRIIIFNDKKFNGIGVTYDNKNNSVMNVNVDQLLHSGKINKAISYKVVDLTKIQEVGIFWNVVEASIAIVLLVVCMVILLNFENNQIGQIQSII